MRKSALIWIMLAVISGAALFHTSQKVTDGRTKLEAIAARTAKESEALRVLEAEWAYLNQPGKLEKLVKQYLDLAPLKGKQFGKVEDFAERTKEAIASALPAPEAEKAPEKPVVKIIPAATPPAVKPAPKRPVEASAAPKPVVKQAPAPAPASNRQFGDLMKSLGVQ
ncbi:MAG: hypothetical protein ACAH80_08895 [Alphaproteobacteria bacterium]